MPERFSWLSILSPEVGDIIEIQRKRPAVTPKGAPKTVYNHWAIYAGRDKNERHLIYNIQLYPPQDKHGTAKISAVKCELEKVVGTDLVRVNNLDDHFCRKGKSPLEAKVVEKQVTDMIGKDFKCEEGKLNAEYYVTKCKYGFGFSSQAIENRIKPRKRSLGYRKLIFLERRKIAQELYGIKA